MKSQLKTDSDFSDYPDLLTRQQAAKMLGIGTTTLDRYANTGVLKKQRSGKMIRFKKSELIEAFKTFQKWQRV